jgi:hypothetical protein
MYAICSLAAIHIGSNCYLLDKKSLKIPKVQYIERRVAEPKIPCSLRTLYGRRQSRIICVSIDPGYVPFGIITIPSSSPPDRSEIIDAQSVLLCVVYYKSLLVLFPLVIVLSAFYSF